MRRLLKIVMFCGLVAFVITGCGDDKREVENSTASEVVVKPVVEAVVEEEKYIYFDEAGGNRGLLRMGMSVDEVLALIEEKNFVILKRESDEHVKFIYDDRGLAENMDFWAWGDSDYVIEIEGVGCFGFNKEEKLIYFSTTRPFNEAIDENTYKENVFFNGQYSTEKGLNLGIDIDEIDKIQGEADEVFAAESDIYYYKLNDELFLEVVVGYDYETENNNIYQIAYYNDVPSSWLIFGYGIIDLQGADREAIKKDIDKKRGADVGEKKESAVEEENIKSETAEISDKRVETKALEANTNETEKVIREYFDSLSMDENTKNVYIDILLSKTKVNYINGLGGFEGVRYLNDHASSVSDYKFSPYGFSVVDMDKDNIPELIVYGDQMTVIVHLENNKPIAYQFNYRDMVSIKTDGTTMNSSGANDTSVYEFVYFNNGDWERNILGASVSNYSTNTVDFYIDGVKVTEDQWYEYFEAFSEKESAETVMVQLW